MMVEQWILRLQAQRRIFSTPHIASGADRNDNWNLNTRTIANYRLGIRNVAFPLDRLRQTAKRSTGGLASYFRLRFLVLEQLNVLFELQAGKLPGLLIVPSFLCWELLLHASRGKGSINQTSIVSVPKKQKRTNFCSSSGLNHLNYVSRSAMDLRKVKNISRSQVR